MVQILKSAWDYIHVKERFGSESTILGDHACPDPYTPNYSSIVT